MKKHTTHTTRRPGKNLLILLVGLLVLLSPGLIACGADDGAINNFNSAVAAAATVAPVATQTTGCAWNCKKK